MDEGYDLTILSIKNESSDSEEDEKALAQIKRELTHAKSVGREQRLKDVPTTINLEHRDVSNSYPTHSCNSDKTLQNLEQTIKTEPTSSQQNENTTEPMKCHVVNDFIIYEIGEANNTANVSSTGIQNVAQPTPRQQATTPIRQPQQKSGPVTNSNLSQRRFRTHIGTILQKRIDKMTHSTNCVAAPSKRVLKAAAEPYKVLNANDKLADTTAETYNTSNISATYKLVTEQDAESNIPTIVIVPTVPGKNVYNNTAPKTHKLRTVKDKTAEQAVETYDTSNIPTIEKKPAVKNTIPKAYKLPTVKDKPAKQPAETYDTRSIPNIMKKPAVNNTVPKTFKSPTLIDKAAEQAVETYDTSNIPTIEKKPAVNNTIPKAYKLPTLKDKAAKPPAETYDTRRLPTIMKKPAINNTETYDSSNLSTLQYNDTIITKATTSNVCRNPLKQPIGSVQHKPYEAKRLRTEPNNHPANQIPPTNSQQQKYVPLNHKRLPVLPKNQKPEEPKYVNVTVKCTCHSNPKSKDEASDYLAQLELKDFFEKMFEESRKLCFDKRKIIKSELLNAVCSAEEDVDAGLLCENCYNSCIQTPLPTIQTSSPINRCIPATAGLQPKLVRFENVNQTSLHGSESNNQESIMNQSDRCDPETSESSSDNDAVDDKTHKHGKRFKKAWLKEDIFMDWLAPIKGSPFQAKCTVCDKVLISGKSELKKHAQAATHRRHYQLRLFGSILGTSDS